MKYRIRQTEYEADQLGVSTEEDTRILAKYGGSSTDSHIEGKRYYFPTKGAGRLSLRKDDWILEGPNGGCFYLDDKTFRAQYEKVPTAAPPKPVVKSEA